MTSDAFRGILGDVYEFPFVNAAAWLVTAEALQKIGGFDPIFIHYGEDDNFCQRIRFHGLKVGVVPDAKVRHDRPQGGATRPLLSSKDYLRYAERRLKIKFADINGSLSRGSYLLFIPLRIVSHLVVDIRAQAHGDARVSVWQLIRGALLAAVGSIKTTKLCWRQIQFSRSTNRNTGMHYLDSDLGNAKSPDI